MAMLKGLAASHPAALPISPRAVMDQVISGEYSIGLMTYNHHAAISANAGAPIAGRSWSRWLGCSASWVTLKDAPHPNTARVFRRACDVR